METNTINPLDSNKFAVELSAIDTAAPANEVGIAGTQEKETNETKLEHSQEHNQEHNQEHTEHEEHHHEHIFIRNNSRLCNKCGCGPNDAKCRNKVFHFVDLWEMTCCKGTNVAWTFSIQRLLMLLLILDLVFVGIEIALFARFIPPSEDLSSSSLYQPKEYICASPVSKAKTLLGPTDSVEHCCTLFVEKYSATDIWNTGIKGNDDKHINVNACLAQTLWDNTTLTASSSTSSSSTSSSSHRQRRMLLWHQEQHHRLLQQDLHLVDVFSAAPPPPQSRELSGGHYDTQLERCYEAGGKYILKYKHTFVEVFFHWASTAILLIFFIELILVIYAMRCKQFFCACRRPIAVHDPVYVVDQHTGEVLCAYGIANHVNASTGSVSVLPLPKATKNQRKKLKSMSQEHNQESVDSIIAKTQMAMARIRVASVTGDETTNVLSSTEVLLDQPYWNVFLYLEEEDDDSASTNCGSAGRSKCCCTWFNKFFVLDFVVVLVAIILENWIDISRSILKVTVASDNNLATLSEATILLLAVRFWRFLRVLHGFVESTRKLSGETEQLEAQVEHRDAILRELVLMNNRVLNHQISDKEFRLKFVEAYSTPSHNYIAEINEKLKKEALEINELAKHVHKNRTISKTQLQIQRKNSKRSKRNIK